MDVHYKMLPVRNKINFLWATSFIYPPACYIINVLLYCFFNSIWNMRMGLGYRKNFLPIISRCVYYIILEAIILAYHKNSNHNYINVVSRPTVLLLTAFQAAMPYTSNPPVNYFRFDDHCRLSYGERFGDISEFHAPKIQRVKIILYSTKGKFVVL